MGFFVLGLLLAGAKPIFRGNFALNAAIGLAPAVAALLYLYSHTRAFWNRPGIRPHEPAFRRARRRLRQVLEEGDVREHFSACSWSSARRLCARMAIGCCLHRERPITFGSAPPGFRRDRGSVGVCFCRRRKDLSAHRFPRLLCKTNLKENLLWHTTRRPWTLRPVSLPAELLALSEILAKNTHEVWHGRGWPRAGGTESKGMNRTRNTPAWSPTRNFPTPRNNTIATRPWSP